MEHYQLGAFTWIHLAAAHPEDVAALRSEFDLPAFALEVARRPHHRPRVERYDGHLLLVLKPARYLDATEEVAVGQLAVLAGPDTVVTIGSGLERDLEGLRAALGEDADRLGLGPLAAVHAVAELVVDNYTSVLDGLDNDVDEIESQVFADGRGSYAERIYRLKSEVQEFRRAVGPLPDELDELRAPVDAPHPRSPGAMPTGPLANLLSDVRVKAVRAAEHVRSLDELLNIALNAHLAQIGIQQNNDMRRISAWVAIVAAPTAMASVYGMNFRHLPGLDWRFGHVIALGLMAAVCGALYGLFRRSGWL